MYKTVIGLEVHCELKTNSKNFSKAKNEYNEEANTNINAVDIALPGTLPLLNKEAVKKSIKMALALHCDIPDVLAFDRKNYFYPDLPKGYQITQSAKPVGTNGYLMINVLDKDIKVDIHDIHLEEDTASLDHYNTYSLLDYNRAGIPLLETVTEPCLHSEKEALAFLEALKGIFLYCDISEARSDRGQMRCDVNISLMKEDAKELGTKVEMKNINSFNGVKEAILYEIRRQTEILDSGEKVVQETRRYDDNEMKTFSMRSKVDAIDYKYYVEPNIPPIKIEKALIEQINEEIPLLQYDRVNKYIKEYNLSRYDANIIVKDKDTAIYFEKVIELGTDPKVTANWLNGSILSYLAKENKKIGDIYLSPNRLKELIDMTLSNKISSKQAKEIIIKALEEDKSPIDIVKSLNIKQIDNEDEIRKIVTDVIDANINLIEEYRKGRNVFDFFVGQVMKSTRGQANPSITAKIIREEIEKR